ncbi:TPA: glycosyltransferase [Enterobacter hormaechei subsp. steigerwaltii]|uniref:glycosyltransferase family 2 protein n=1 Tax=Enterobacter hormaechei TaxID=158836 RepID=UPI0005364B68|nr:glycosyltransferase [Enterobacter hormaechei]MDO0899670.1 glycosyltransferase [Enterobacter hormaechei]PNP07744.1 glycosyl transferase family 2 [Enterobacter hormaechei]UTI05543.1 glycosyltransferase [Enterobacter hormaechei subsp. steigerwaltii]HAV1868543.1 glycosyltransferase [Enterobacter hormaechei subsp. steigerwaltii]HCM9098763.1 glycosyltransferase [Enterobacter hormaechei subsp. steigerwaltii]
METLNTTSGDLISVIMPSYNSADTISASIESILSQSYQNWELLITDDGSTDGTLEILSAYAEKDSRIKFFSNSKNSGAAVSRNNSIKHSKGAFLAFLDSDDIWLKNKLQKQLSFMNVTQNNDFSFTSYSLIDENGKHLGKTVDMQGDGLSFSYHDMLRKKATLGCSTVMLRKSSFEDISMPLIRTGQDYALWLKLLKTGKNAYLLNEVLTEYRILPNSISRNKFKKSKRQWQIYREIEKLNFLSAGVCFAFYAWRAVFRR